MEGGFLKQLSDFTDLRKKQDYNTSSSKQSSLSVGVDLDMENNQMIMKSFKDLREKFKVSQKQNTNLRQQMKILQIEIIQLQQSQNNLRTINHQLKQKNSQITNINDDFKKKIGLMRDSVDEKQILVQQLEFVKQNMMQIQMNCQNLEEQKKKLIEISIQEKFNLEEKINKLLFKSQSDDKYIREVQQALSKSKENILKLQSQVKKLQIKYDQEIFNKKWSKDNFQIEKYQEEIKKLQSELNEVKSKNKKQKEKRTELQKRVIQLQSIAGLWNVKAEAYESEADIMNKRVRKMEKRVSVAKNSVTKMANQRICYEQKFFRSVGICQELINRVKRELVGDMVQLAKSCEYRLNKLKDDDLRASIGKQTVSFGNKCLKSNKKAKKSAEKYSTATKNTQNNPTNFEAQPKQILRQSNGNFTPLKQSDKKQTRPYYLSNQQVEKQNDKNADREYENLQFKIRKQRELMQKKLKQKMLYRKIEVGNESERGKLRQDYLKLIFQK